MSDLFTKPASSRFVRVDRSSIEITVNDGAYIEGGESLWCNCIEGYWRVSGVNTGYLPVKFRTARDLKAAIPRLEINPRGRVRLASK